MSTRRRSRYTINYNDGSKEVVVAYSAADANEYFSPRRDKVIRSVAKGDYRKAVAKQEAFQRGGFSVSQSQLREAIRLLEIEFPVKIRYSNHYAYTSGSDGHHNLERKGGKLVHNIMVKSYLTAERASFVLWHELTHAMQSERDGGGTYDGYLKAHRNQRNWSYSRRPWEREANAVAEENQDIKLCY